MKNTVTPKLRWNHLTRVSAAILIALIAAACGSSGSSSSNTSQPSGGSSTTGATKQSPIGVFISGSKAVTYSVAEVEGLDQGAKATGIPYQLFEGNFDPGTQYTQLQNAFEAKRFTNYIIHPAADNLCQLVKDAVASQKINVVVMNAPLCGQHTATGDALWTPGTVTFVGGNPNFPGYLRFWKTFATMIPAGAKILSVTGPKINGNAVGWVAGLEAAKAAGSDLNVVATLNSDYTTPTTLKDVTAYLQANRDVDTVVTNYIAMTQGVVKAVQALGLSAKVKVYDYGGDKEALTLIKAGDVVATTPYFPVSMAAAAYDAIAKVLADKPVPHFIGEDGNSELTNKFYWITKDNADTFTPQY